jgi:predicted MPP superfamily phosphohydrolase
MLLTISLILLPIYFYVGFRTAASVALLRPGWKRRARKGVLFAIGWMYLLPVVAFAMNLLGLRQYLFVQNTSAGLLDVLFHYPVWVGLIIVAELLAPFLLLETIGGIFRFFPSLREKARRILAITRCALVALAILYVPVRSGLDTLHVRDSALTLQIKNLPPELRGLRLSLVSDIQVDRYTGPAKVGQVHEIIRERKPEFLFSGGDIVTGGTDFLISAAEAMCGMKGSVASVAVMGDHDHWSAPEEVRESLVGCGWDFLYNQHRIFAVRGKRVLVTGLTHIYSRRLADGELDSLLECAPEADLRILLSHQPAERVVEQAAAHGYDLILAGHTHGGQVVLHPLGIPLTPSMRETKYYSGVYHVGESTVVVTDGVGLTLAPIRYHAPAEVTSIVLE